MIKNALLDQWILRILRHIKSKRGYQSQMIHNGHLSAHVFSPKNPVFDISLGRFIRMVLNYALVCKDTEKVHEFKDDWNRLGDAIMLLVDDGIVDNLNQLIDPKKKNELT